MQLALLCAVLGVAAAISPIAPAPIHEATAASPRDFLAVQDGALRLTVDGALRFEDGPSGRVWILDGRANRPLAEVATFIHEDGFADVRRDPQDARRFTVVVREGHELSTLLTGQRLFLRSSRSAPYTSKMASPTCGSARRCAARCRSRARTTTTPSPR
jgi:hypothetical protein